MAIKRFITSVKFTTLQWGDVLRCAVNGYAQNDVGSLNLDQLEARVLYSASPMPVADAESADSEAADTAGSSTASSQDESQSAPTDSSPDDIRTSDDSLILLEQVASQLAELDESEFGIRHELVFVDTATQNYQQLLDDLLANQAGSRQIDVYLLDSARDGITQITDVLAQYEGLDAVHFVSHGVAGAVKLGDTWLTSDISTTAAGQIASWGNALTTDGDLLFYGCDFASNQEGQLLVGMLSQLTGADVAASIDDTGNGLLGGNWTLEYAIGTIESQIAFSIDVQQNWLSVLANETISDNFATASYSNNNGTQVWSTDWIENDSGGGGASGGWFSVSGGVLNTQTHDTGNYIYRQADLSSALTATLSFSYNNTLQNVSTLLVQASSNGGGSFTTLTGLTFNQSTNVGSGTISVDISAYMAANTQIRFYVSGSETGGGKYFMYVDNVQIAYTTNSAPVLDSAKSPALSSIIEDAGSPTGAVGALISSLVDFASPSGQVDNVTDANAGDPLGVAVTATNSSNGTWYYSINNGTTWSALGSVTDSSARLLAADANTRIYFQANADYNGTIADAITFRAWDQFTGTNGSLANTTTNGGTSAFSSTTDVAALTVTAVNDAPAEASIEVTPLGYTENDGPVAITSTLAISDLDDTNIESAVVQITGNYAGAQDVLAFTNQNGITGNLVGGTLTLSGSATLAQYEAAIRSITYTNTSENPSTATRTVSFTVNDGDANSNTQTRDIAIGSVNDAPTNAGALPNDITVTEDVSSNLDLSSIDLSDVDASSGSLTVKLTTSTGGNLTAAAGTGITIGANATGAITLTGSLTDLNNYLNVASNVQYLHSTANLNGNAADTIHVVVNDNGNTGTGGGADQDLGTVNVDITATNDAPVNILPGSRTVYQNGNLTFSTAHGSEIEITDVDAGGSSVQVSLVSTSGLLTLSGTSGLFFSVGDGTADSSMTFTGTAAAINSALDGLAYTPTTDYSGTATIQVTTNDQGNSGSGGAQSDVDVIMINVIPANSVSLWLTTDKSATVNGGTSWTDGEVIDFAAPGLALEPGTTSGTFAGVFDLDAFTQDGNADISALHRVTRSVVVGSGGSTMTLQKGDVLFTIEGSETIGGVSVTEKDLVLFRPTILNDYSAGTFSILINSPTGDKIREIALVEQNISVGGVALNAGDLLLVQSSSSYDKDVWRFQATSVGNGTTAGTLTEFIDGADIGFSQQIGGLELVERTTTIGNATLNTGELLLSLRNSATVGTNNLSVTGYDIFRLNVTQAGTNTSATASLLFQGSDVGLSSGGEEFHGLALVATNYAPTLAGANNFTSIAEDAFSNSGTLVSTLVGGQISDADQSAISGIAVTAVDSTNGTWQYSINSGGSWINFSSPTASTARLLASDGSTLIRFVPNANYNGNASITYRAWDQTTGSIGSTADTTSNGGASSYSTATANSTIMVTPVNDAPVLDNSGTMTFTTITEDQTSNVGNTVVSIISSAGGDRITDVDSGAIEGIAITALTSGNGTWEYSTDGGSSWTVVGAVANNSALLLRSADLLRFVPNTPNATTGDITFRGWDQTSGTFGTKVDVSTNGGTTAFSSATEVASISVTAINDAPTIASSYTYNLTGTNEDTASSGTLASTILTSSTWADVDTGAVSGLAITGKTGNGTWQYSTDGVTWNTFGAVTSTNALLITLTTQVRYIPDAVNGETATFSYKAWDQTSGTASTNATANYATTVSSGGTTAFSTNTGTAQIVVTSINDAPTAVVDNATAVETGGVSNATAGTNPTGNVLTNDTDVDTGDTKTVSGVAAGIVGSASTNVGSAVIGSYGSISVAANGAYTYTVDNDNATVQALRTAGHTITDVFTYTLRDTAGLTSTSQITVTIQGANDAPTDITAANLTVAENAANSTAIGTATAVDIDIGDSFTYALTDSADGRFAINSTTGAISVANGSLLNYEAATSHAITVRVTDAGGLTHDKALTINVTDVNETPVTAVIDSDAVTNFVLENVSVGTTVGVTAFSSDADGTDTVSYSLDDDAGGRFAINSTTGVVTVSGVIDREAASSYNITVRATSTDTSTTTQVVNIAIGDVDEFDVGSVSDSNATANTVAENATVGTAVGITAAASDADATNNTISYTLDDDAGGLFAIHATTGVVTVNGGLDYETATSHNITARATSSDGSFNTQAFTINVTDINEFAVSVISDSNGTANEVAEDAANGDLVSLTALASDADRTNNTITYSLDDDASGRFAIDSSTGTVTLADASLLDFETSASHDIIVRASSSDGSFQTQTFTISVSDKNDAPIITSNGGGSNAFVNVAEGSFAVATVVVQDADLPGDVLTFSIIGGADAGWFEIDSSSGQLRFKVAPNFEVPQDANQDGIHDIIVRVADGRGGLDQQTIHVTVTDVNDAPIAAADGDFRTDQVSSVNVSSPGLLANDFDEDGDPLTAVLIANAQHGQVTLNADGSFVYTPNAGFSGTDQFQYAASDGTLLSAPVTIEITVTLVAPSTPASGPIKSASEVEASPTADDQDNSPPKVITTMVPSAAAAPAAVTTDVLSGTLGAALGIAYLPPEQEGSRDKSERAEQPELSDLSFAINVLEDTLHSTTRKLAESAARPIRYTSFGLIADTVLSLAFDSSDGSDDSVVWEKELRARQLIVGSAAALTSSLSVGYVVWMLRGGTLVASFMSSIPAWCSFDPLPIVDSFENTHANAGGAPLDESLASIAGPHSSTTTTDS